jgi:hypothetical protein
MVMTEKVEVVLKYVGDGAFLPNVPARDLAADDLKAIAEVDTAGEHDRKALLKSGLYEPAEPAKGK